jgi:hypothetical protein
MTKTRVLALAAALCAGAAVPALAQPAYGPLDRPGFDHIGSVDFSFRPDRETEYGTFGGRVDALNFRARNGTVRCNEITATFNNGQTRLLYRGTLPADRDVLVDLPGRDRMIRRIDFDCRSTFPRVTRVDIAADIGPYRAEWRRSPDWERRWSRMFNWDDDRFAGGSGVTGPLYGGTGPATGWVTVGSEVFDGLYDQETTITGLEGRDVNRIALRPVDDDARCSHVTATFANGTTRELDIDDRDVLQEGRVIELDLPGARRDVMRIDMACHAENGGQVRMMVMANR